MHAPVWKPESAVLEQQKITFFPLHLLRTIRLASLYVYSVCAALRPPVAQFIAHSALFATASSRDFLPVLILFSPDQFRLPEQPCRTPSCNQSLARTRPSLRASRTPSLRYGVAIVRRRPRPRRVLFGGQVGSRGYRYALTGRHFSIRTSTQFPPANQRQRSGAHDKMGAYKPSATECAPTR